MAITFLNLKIIFPGESQPVSLMPRFSFRSYDVTTLPPQTQQWHYKQEQTPQIQDYKITRQNANPQAEQNGRGEYRENQETAYGQGNKRNEEKQEYVLLKGKGLSSQTYAQVTNGESSNLNNGRSQYHTDDYRRYRK